MKVQVKIFVVIIMAVFFATFIMSWRNSGDLVEQHKVQTQAFVEHQSKALRLAVNFFAKNQMEQIRARLGRDSLGLYEGVETLALLSESARVWGVDWVKGATTEQVNSFISKLPMARVRQGEQTWVQVKDTSGQPKIALLFTVRMQREGQVVDRVALAIYQMQGLASVNSMFKGSAGSAMVIDHLGHALAYPEQQYLGAKVDEHPLVSMILKNQDLNFNGSFKNDDGDRAMGAYEKVPNTNLYVVAEKSYEPRAALAFGLVLKNIFIAFGVILLFCAVAFVWLLPDVKSFGYLRESILRLGQRESLNQPDFRFPNGVNVLTALHRLQLPDGEEALPIVDEADVLATPTRVEVAIAEPPAAQANSVQKNVITDMGYGIARSLRGPLSAILGHVQVAESKSTDSSLKEHFKVIEDEARRGRDIVENLARFSGDSSPSLESMTLQDFVNNYVEENRGSWNSQSVSVEQTYLHPGPVQVDPVRLKSALGAISNFLLRHMESQTTKNLVFLTQSEGASVTLTVRGEGPLFTEVDTERYLTPFVGGDDCNPLGLSLAKAQIESSSGEVKLMSGTVDISIEFPLHEQTQPVHATDIDEITESTTFADVEITNVTALESPESTDITSEFEIVETHIDKTRDEIPGLTPIAEGQAMDLPAPPPPEEEGSEQEVSSEEMVTSTVAIEIKENIEEPDNAFPGLPDTPPAETETMEADKIQIRKPKVRLKT